MLAFVRGWWCPKEQVRVRGLVTMQDEIQREYGRIAAVTVDEPYVNGAFRAGIGAHFPFLSDEDRGVARELDLLELTDEWHLPHLPFTFLLDTHLRIARDLVRLLVVGQPDARTSCRLGFREITRARAAELRPAGGLGRPAASRAGRRRASTAT